MGNKIRVEQVTPGLSVLEKDGRLTRLRSTVIVTETTGANGGMTAYVDLHPSVSPSQYADAVAEITHILTGKNLKREVVALSGIRRLFGLTLERPPNTKLAQHRLSGIYFWLRR